MMDWTAGYNSEVEYTAGFYREQSPVYLNFVCVLHGYEPVPLDQPYNYCELGFGRGLTVNLLAAANPTGSFFAADFNPAHVAGAQEIAKNAKLKNLTLLENSFEELAQGAVADLPQFDFITLHGIYTWVTAENRDYITQFISRYLKPGGLVYLSYNAMPGWTMVSPVQRLLVEHADLHPNRSDKQIDLAAIFVEKMVELNAGYFLSNPGLKQRLDTIKNGNRNYLVHEYMHKNWQPLYFADVARDMSKAKLDFIGSAELPFAFQSLYLNQERQDFLNTITDQIIRETVQDYFLNTGFRKDVFVRGARRMSSTRQAEFFSNANLALIAPRGDISLNMKLAIGEVNGKPEVYNPAIDAIAEKPKTLKELSQLPWSSGNNFKSMIEVASILTGSNQSGIYFNTPTTTDTDAAKRLNRILAEQTRYSDEYQALCSPVLGNGINANYLERLLVLLLLDDPTATEPEKLAIAGWNIMKAQGRCMIKEGKRLELDEENIMILVQNFSHLISHKLPIWKQLQIL